MSSEVVWNETAANEGAGGGGVSDQFALPSWQASAGVGPRAASQPAGGRGRGRGAGPLSRWPASTGRAQRRPDRRVRHGRARRARRGGQRRPDHRVQIYPDGKAQVVGGTSAVAPLWSALIARLAQATGQRFGLIQPVLYAGVSPGTDVPGFRDITSGNNGAYSAGPGWDACTGLGSPGRHGAAEQAAGLVADAEPASGREPGTPGSLPRFRLTPPNG